MRKKLLSLLVLLMTAVTGAWATEVTIATNQQQTSYTSGDITISVQDFVDGDGAHVSSWCPMIITCGDGNVLQSVVVTIGYYPENALDAPHIALPARGNALDAPHIALPARGNALDAPHIALPARGNALDVPHIALPAYGNALDVPHIALPALGNAFDVPHIALPARGKALDVPHIALPAYGNAPDVPHIALPAHGNAPRCTPQRTIF